MNTFLENKEESESIISLILFVCYLSQILKLIFSWQNFLFKIVDVLLALLYIFQNW